MLEEIISEVFPLLIFIAIGVFASIGKIRKAKATQGSKGPQAQATEGDSVNQNKSAGFVETFKQTMKELVDDDKYKAKDEKKGAAPAAAVSPTIVRIPLERKELNSNIQKIAPKNKDSHVHGAEVATTAGKPVKVKTEKVVVGGSAGGAITEGCIEHYGIRAVIDEFPENDDNPEVNELQRILVLGEILNHPRYKNANYKRN